MMSYIFVSLMPIMVPGIEPSTERHFTFIVISKKSVN